MGDPNEVKRFLDLEGGLKDFEGIEVNVEELDLWRFELESYRLVLKDEIKRLRESLLENKGPLEKRIDSSKLEVAISKYTMFENLILEEFVYIYKQYSEVIKKAESEERNQCAKAFKKQLFDLYSAIILADKETMFYVKLLEDIEALERQIILLETENGSLRVHLSLFDEGSKITARELMDYRARAEEGDRASRRLAEELQSSEQYMAAYLKLQSDFSEVMDSYQKVVDEKEALEEQIFEKDSRLESFKSSDALVFENSEDLFNLRKRLKDYENQNFEQQNHIKALTMQVASLERMYQVNIPDMIKELSYSLQSVSSAVEEVRQKVCDSSITPANLLYAIGDE